MTDAEHAVAAQLLVQCGARVTKRMVAQKSRQISFRSGQYNAMGAMKNACLARKLHVPVCYAGSVNNRAPHLLANAAVYGAVRDRLFYLARDELWLNHPTASPGRPGVSVFCHTGPRPCSETWTWRRQCG